MGKLFFPAVLACFLVLEGDPAIAVSPSEGERLFVEGTSFFRAPGAERDASKGLAKLQASAALGYRFAPYGLCIALSAEAEIINLVRIVCLVSRCSPKEQQVLGEIRLQSA